MNVVPCGKVNKDDHYLLKVTVLFYTSTFHYSLGNVAFTTAESCPTYGGVKCICLNYFYHFIKDKLYTQKTKEVGTIIK